MVWLLNIWWHVAQPLPPAAWSPELRLPLVCTSSSPAVLEKWFTWNTRTGSPPPITGCSLLLDQFPKMVHWLAAGTAVLAQRRGWPRLSDGTHQVPFHLVSQISKVITPSRSASCRESPLEGKPVPAHRNPYFPIFAKSSQIISQPQNTLAQVLLYTNIMFNKK